MSKLAYAITTEPATSYRFIVVESLGPIQQWNAHTRVVLVGEAKSKEQIDKIVRAFAPDAKRNNGLSYDASWNSASTSYWAVAYGQPQFGYDDLAKVKVGDRAPEHV